MSADVIVVGAGPAGLAAAREVAVRGLHVLLLDEQPAPGGQIYRAVTENRQPGKGETDILGDDYWNGLGLAGAVGDENIEYVPGATVWTAEADPPAIGYMSGGRTFLRTARDVILATGAYERPVPVPGWTLPGVMSAGAAQILMKAEGAVLEGPVILAGSGPLLLLVACQLHRAGTPVAAVLETTSWKNYLSAAPYLLPALGAREMLGKGLAMRRELKRSGIPLYSAVADLTCEGDGAFERISFTNGGRKHTLDAALLLLHEGVVPNVQITRLLDADHEWVASQRYWRPVLDKWGETSVPHFLVAGDGGGIAGAQAAEVSGRLAGLRVAQGQGVIDAGEYTRAAAALFRKKRKLLRIRPLLDHLYSPPKSLIAPQQPDAIVCRCEEVTLAKIRDCMATGCDGPNQLKAYSRCGMGPCQGRMCGLSVSEIMARERGVPIEEIGYYRIRSPIKPIPLSALAALEVEDEATAD